MFHYAEKLVSFIDAASKKDNDDKKNCQLYTNQTVSEFAIIGMLMMGWVEK